MAMDDDFREFVREEGMVIEESTPKMVDGFPSFSNVKQIRITNTSKQMVSLILGEPDGDFFLTRELRLMKGKSITLPSTHVHQGQIENLQRSREISVQRK